jgi:hypothetical protein
VILGRLIRCIAGPDLIHRDRRDGPPKALGHRAHVLVRSNVELTREKPCESLVSGNSGSAFPIPSERVNEFAVRRFVERGNLHSAPCPTDRGVQRPRLAGLSRELGGALKRNRS